MSVYGDFTGSGMSTALAGGVKREASQVRPAARLPTWDAVLLILVVLGSSSLTIAHVHERVALPLTVFLCCIAFLSPYSGLALLAASQVIPDAPGMEPLTVARMAFIGWLVSNLVKRHSFEGALPVLKMLAPLALWILFVSLVRLQPLPEHYLLAWILALVGGVLVRETRGQFHLALFAICLGAAPAALGYWGSKLGIAMTGETAMRAGILRMGVGRAAYDSLCATNIALAAIGFLGLGVSGLSHHAACRVSDTSFRVLCVGLFLFVLPALAFTLSRTGIVVFLGGLLVVSLVVMLSRGGRLRQLTASARKILLVSLVAGMVVFLVSGGLNPLETTIRVTRKQGAIGGRGPHWRKMAVLSLQYPVLGVPPDKRILAPWGEGTRWELLGTCPHNVYLGFSYVYGFPAMILFCIFFFYPPFRLVRQHGVALQVAPFLACHFVLSLFLFAMPFGNFKTIYLIWTAEEAAAH